MRGTRRQSPISAAVYPSDLSVDQRRLGLELLNQHVTNYPPPKTGPISVEPWPYLIPTSLKTAAEPCVDTVQEAGLIILAAQLGELGLARDLLGFYWEKSQAGVKALPPPTMRGPAPP